MSVAGSMTLGQCDKWQKDNDDQYQDYGVQWSLSGAHLYSVIRTMTTMDGFYSHDSFLY